MISTNKIESNVRNMLHPDKEKVVYAASRPLLHKIKNGSIYIAMFVSECIDVDGSRFIKTPNKIVMIGLSGDEAEYKLMSWPQKYQIRYPEKADGWSPKIPLKEFFAKTRDLFDTIRQILIETGDLAKCRNEYTEYLQCVYENVRPDFHPYYAALNNVFLSSASRNETTETEIPEDEKSYITGISWKPGAGLESLGAAELSILKRISEHMRFLPPKKDGYLRFEYPLLCYREDFPAHIEPLMYADWAVENRLVETGHYQTLPKETLLCRCPHAEKCIFRHCIYIVAAYIRYCCLTGRKAIPAFAADGPAEAAVMQGRFRIHSENGKRICSFPVENASDVYPDIKFLSETEGGSGIRSLIVLGQNKEQDRFIVGSIDGSYTGLANQDLYQLLIKANISSRFSQ